ncbi:stage II sporulation protein D [Cohnella pontilimi]|uniref:Stage II sporulation protein D n=1 Tax=Cohnella pontilimi TaxID=2564100 RepID=A0A4U0FAS3_9BACL|nr:stage II sporulation protein D [Cohnella pontilimi]TJY41913.1 stage II sporulation protein D [Cohnella pontilimi]
MEWAKRLEWAGFTAGIVLALILWSNLHTANRTETAQLMAASSEDLETWAQPAANVKSDKSQSSSENNVIRTNAGPASNRGGESDNSLNSNPNSNPNSNRDSPHNTADKDDIPIRVYLTEQRRVETVPLEDYIRGVVAAEMPPSFHPAALEAQAMAARTYIMRRLLEHDRTNIPVQDADVTDTVTHQAYRSLEQMNRLRDENGQAWRKADEAARNTRGKIITYDGKPIEALYFSASNGYTENSENVFPFALPYLRSVTSPWDRPINLPGAAQTTQMPLKEFYEKLGIDAISASARLNNSPKMKVTGWTDGRRIKSLTVIDRTFTGQEFRERLGLRSTSFTWRVKDGTISFTTYGNGHGVGMSQWGAEGMAQDGHTAEQILKYYYKGTQITEVSKLVPSL